VVAQAFRACSHRRDFCWRAAATSFIAASADAHAAQPQAVLVLSTIEDIGFLLLGWPRPMFWNLGVVFAAAHSRPG